jgi:ATP-dependent RNA helicase DeaD
MSFRGLGISEQWAEKLEGLRIVSPTPIQQDAIPHILRGRDVVGQAQTGTGKTLAFLLPIVEKLDPAKEHVQALIVAPTRELAIQITEEVLKLTEGTGVHTLAVYGGQDVLAQMHRLEGTVHIIVATPGRLLDHVRRETVSLGRVETVVLDEADQMLHIGFLSDIELILDETPSDRQTLLFSATMPDEVRDLSERFMNNPLHIKVKSETVTVKEIRQRILETTDRAKQGDLMSAIRQLRPFMAIIFCRTKRRVSKLNEALQEHGFNSDELHGDMSQAKREDVMKRFRKCEVQFLIATDVAARGIDVDGITHVFNYDIPHDAESYIHRIGRTGRAGSEGLAVTFVGRKDEEFLREIENAAGMKLKTLVLDKHDKKSADSGGDSSEKPRNFARGRTRSKQGNKEEQYKRKPRR